MFNITGESVERLKDEGHDLWTLSLWERWLEESAVLTEVINGIRKAFRGAVLGDGVGLLEAIGIDERASERELESLREKDQRHNWENIEADLLNQNFYAITFFDAKGFVFHLPAFLIAELSDELVHQFIDILIRKQTYADNWMDLINEKQSGALISTLDLMKFHPYYLNQSKRIDATIERLSRCKF